MTSTKKRAPKRTGALEFLEELDGPLTMQNFLVSWRETEELSQTEFAKRLGVTRANLCDIEKGRRPVTVALAKKFAKALKHPPEVFVLMVLRQMIREAGVELEVSIPSRKKAA